MTTKYAVRLMLSLWIDKCMDSAVYIDLVDKPHLSAPPSRNHLSEIKDWRLYIESGILSEIAKWMKLVLPLFCIPQKEKEDMGREGGNGKSRRAATSQFKIPIEILVSLSEIPMKIPMKSPSFSIREPLSLFFCLCCKYSTRQIVATSTTEGTPR
jgi:hypothetical protein